MALLHGIWKPAMALGIQDLDEHHKTLLRLILETRNAVAEKAPAAVVKEIIASLKSYAMYHFKSEERHMLNMKYRNLEAHRVLHREFIEKINTFALDFPANPVKTNIELLQFLSAWFVRHILDEDHRFVRTEDSN